MKPRPPRLLLPRYVRRKWLKGDSTWGYFFEIPTWARGKGCPVESQALGKDYAEACQVVEDVLLKHFDSWRTAGKIDLIPDRTAPGSFDWMAGAYKGSPKFKGLSKSQQRNHDLGLGLVAGYKMKDGRRFGSIRLNSVTSDVVDRLYEKLSVVDGRERRTTINHAMKSCRRAWNVVQRAHPKIVPTGNPFSKMGLKDVSKATPTAIWEELEAFVAKADEMGFSSLGTAALVTWEWCQREEHVFGHFMAAHYRPKDRPDEVFIVHPKTGEKAWIPLSHNGALLFPELTPRLDRVAVERQDALMIARDQKRGQSKGSVPWATATGDLSYMRHRVKAIINAAGIRSELTFTSFRHGGMTEMGDADLTDAQIRAISRHKDAKTLPRYVKKTHRQIIEGTRKRRAVRSEDNGVSE